MIILTHLERQIGQTSADEGRPNGRASGRSLRNVPVCAEMPTDLRLSLIFYCLSDVPLQARGFILGT